jgi:hypothetical protein
MQIDPDRLEELAAQYNTHAEFYRERAARAVSPDKEEWLQLAAQCAKLAEQADTKSPR